MKHSVAETTLRHGLCIGCGVCTLVCPSDAVAMDFRAPGVYRARVDASRCTDCGACASYCPHTREELRRLALDTAAAADPARVGLEGAVCSLAFDTGPGRRASASGGVVTRFFGGLLEAGELDGVIHGEGVAAAEGEPHFRAAFSAEPAELEGRRGSFYAPLCPAPVVDEHARGRSRRLAMVTTPCVVRAYRRLFARHADFSANRVLLAALVCSHNVAHGFADFLYRSLGLPPGEPFRLDYRSKKDIPHAGRYRIRVRDAAGRELAHPDRMECAHAMAWRAHAFVLPPCHFCPDFWGREADISVKDAWGRWAQDPRGTCMVALRDPGWEAAYRSAPGLYREALTAADLVDSQPRVAAYRQGLAAVRWTRPVWHPVNLRSGYAAHRLVAGYVRRAWPRRGASRLEKGIRLREAAMGRLHRLVARTRSGLSRTVRLAVAPFSIFLWPLRVVRYRRRRVDPAILVVGGYGYGNHGDEAQLHAAWTRLRELFPGYPVKVLTPDLPGTHALHGCTVGAAPRVAFFDAHCSPVYRLDTRKRRAAFLWRGLGIYLNALFMKVGLSPFMLGPRRAGLLGEIRDAAMVFFCGGGYLTGATRSRLWDGALLGRLCRLFDVPLVLSGQTMGIWDGSFSRRLAFWGFARAALIGLRDPEASLRDLEAAGIRGDHVRVVHDDALFCESAEPGKVRSALAAAGLAEGDAFRGYRVLQFHYWGVTDPGGRIRLLETAERVVRRLCADGTPLVLVSMSRGDDAALGDLRRYCADLALPALLGERDFRVVRGVIGASRLCVAMKHHPLIFALGEGVPVISLARGAYYRHKNAGALALFGLEEWNLDMENPGWEKQFSLLLERLEREEEKVRARIDRERVRLRERGKEFDRRLQGLLLPVQETVA